MCGIAGVYKKQAPNQVKKMIGKIKHRGPNGEGVINLTHGTLGHTRLAIIDVEGGRQPMQGEEAWIVFNGEIYNFRELAKEHLPGSSLRSHSDTEVLLRLYQKYGPRCVELIHGMFAFAILRGNDLFLARDPLGIKPLYYGFKDGALYFASEIKSLAVATDEINEFPAGHSFHSQEGWQSYYRIDPDLSDDRDENFNLQAIHDILEESVRLRLMADVPLGISLSGGLDSSIVAMLAKRFSQHLHSFAVGMNGSEDLQAARMMSRVLGTQHHERIYTEQEILDALPQIIYHLESFDPALVRSAIPNYFLAEMASQDVKVILTGEGADEIYAGYDYLKRFREPDRLQQEMVNITTALHNTNLQRADRIPMAFGLEARVPFLDTRSVALGLGLPPGQKVHQDRPAKYMLRRAFMHDLPAEIANRPKQKFSKGAGSSDIVQQIAEQELSQTEFNHERARLRRHWGYTLPNKEALYYYRILRTFYEDRWILPTMGQSRSL
jgi:asparagine synthase (glutamine-hydrolysing)